MSATSNLRVPRLALAGATAVLLWIGACENTPGPVDIQDPDSPSTEFFSALIVTNPVTSAGSAIGASPALSGLSSGAIDEIVFVSLPPGTVPSGETAVIRTRGAEAQSTAAMVDGGFDPVPVSAVPGDTLDISIELVGGGAPLLFYSVVPSRRPPVIVRTDPPPRKRDVPLNAALLVVFSEPIDARTLTASSVQVLLEGAPVPGTVRFGDGANLTATFTPAELLVAEADYTLLITSEIEDLDGEALAEELRVDFTTVQPPPSPPPSSGLVIVSGDDQPGKAGQELPEPFVVRVTDGSGAGVPDVEVTWTVTSGEGALDGQWASCPIWSWGSKPSLYPLPTSARSDPEGLARVSFMPTWFGPVTVTASVPGAPAVAFTTDASDAGATVEIVPGNGDTHEPWVWSFFGWIHHPPLVVTVKDGEGNPVPHIGVNWDVESGEGSFQHCGWMGNGAVSNRTEGGSVQSAARFEPAAIGPSIVTATVPAIQGSPSVTFEIDATVTLIWLETVASGVVFSGPEGRGHSDVVVPVGTRVEFGVLTPTFHIVSTSSPPDGGSFDSGIRNSTPVRYDDPEAEPLFGFVPNVAGTWTFVDQISGATGTVTATNP